MTTPSVPQALVVDDDSDFTEAVAELIRQHGLEVTTVGTLQEARAALREALPDLLLVDLILPDGSGLELLSGLDPGARTRAVVITGHASIDSAIEALRARVFDFLVKPIDVRRLQACLKSLLSTPVHPADLPASLARLVGASPAIQELHRVIRKVAPTEATVLLQGESGTGKELVARAIHELSPRRDRPYLAVNCGAVSPNLIGSELFGHERGSFTGAARQHKGHFERTAGGTLFLDEITEMPLELQVQLLRVLETGRLLRLGGDQEIAVDVRLVAATNRDPERAIADGSLREDLYFRLSVFPIRVAPLREREGDVALLARHFLAQFNGRHGTDKHFSETALHRLEEHPWPGNVRELRNTIQRAFILADHVIEAEHIATGGGEAAQDRDNPLRFAIGTSIDDAERRLIMVTLDHYQGNKQKAADALGISLKTLYNRLKRYEAA